LRARQATRISANAVDRPVVVTRRRRIRIVIGDHHPLVLRGVVDLLKSAKDFEVVAK
jgi:hypothetical protein